MKRGKSFTDDNLRPHYDLDKLEVVALGPGWAKKAAAGRTGKAGSGEGFYAQRLAQAGLLFSSPRIDRELVTDFFMSFARAEYALKKAGYVRGNKKSGAPELKWEEFAQKISERLLKPDEPAVVKAIEYLVKHPPRKQIVQNGALKWQPRPADGDPAVSLIRAITTVRNNLFHGGKQTKGTLAERDRSLLVSCLVLLCYSISLEQDVMRFFYELPVKRGAA